MKNILLACLFIFSFEEAFSQTGYKDTDRELSKRERSGDQVVRGQSSTVRRAMPAGSRKEIQKSDSISGVECTDKTGKKFTPKNKGYTKCVDKANRIE
jgi:hypothetical protein